MELRHQRVGPEDVEPLHAILRECGIDMRERLGLTHWVPPYPLESMRRDAETREVFAVFSGEGLLGTFTVGTDLPAYYRLPGVQTTAPWTADDRALYVGRLAVRPHLQRRGIGTWCMETTQGLARDRGYPCLRLDVVEAHTGGVAFYRRLGYAECGRVWDPAGRFDPAVCMGKALQS